MSDRSNVRANIERHRAEVRVRLLTSRNSDGAWPYRVGRESRIEPTCWAMLALAQADGRPPDTHVLRARRHEGWLIDVVGTPPNHAFNALGALTLLQSASTAALAESIVRGLIGARGESYAQQPEFRQDNSLQAWSWVEGTFSWVEPTAWCLLLLKQRLAQGPAAGAEERIRIGEQMLRDRACRGGGWNYGSANVYGKDLPPYVPTTALALLALQNRRDDPIVTLGLRRLQDKVSTERSAIALSLAIICLRIYGVGTAALEASLAQLHVDRDRSEGENDLLGLAMSLYALSGSPMSALTLGRV
jgi:hypothetical protein